MGEMSIPDGVTAEDLAAALVLVRRNRRPARPRRAVQDEETIHIRGEGGAVFEVAPSKMSKDMQRRLQLGYLRQVNPDGSPLRDAAAPAPAGGGGGGSALTEGRVPRPAKSAPKRDWVLYAVTVLGLDAERAEGMTRQDLIDLPDPPPAETDVPTGGKPPAAGRPADDAPKSEWIDHVARKGLLSRDDAAAYTKADLIAMVT